MSLPAITLMLTDEVGRPFAVSSAASRKEDDPHIWMLRDAVRNVPQGLPFSVLQDCAFTMS